MSAAADTTSFKEAQRSSWDGVAAAWEKWAEQVDAGAHELTEVMLREARLVPGARVLDIASGIGEPGLRAASVVAPRGHVTLTDLSPQMLAIARRRAEAQGIDNVSFQQADAEVLDVRGGPFDAALCRFGLMFLPDPGAALRAVQHHLVAGGRFVTSVWAAPPSVPMLSIPAKTLREALGLAPPPPGTPGIFALADPAPLTQTLRELGFEDIDVRDVDVEMDFTSVEQLLEFVCEVASPIKAMLAEQPPQRRDELLRRVAEAMRLLTDDDGALRTHNRALVISATAPAARD